VLGDWVQHFRSLRCLTSVRRRYKGFKSVERFSEYNIGDLEQALKNVLSRDQAQVPRVKCKDVGPPDVCRADLILPNSESGGDDDGEDEEEEDDDDDDDDDSVDQEDDYSDEDDDGLDDED